MTTTFGFMQRDRKPTLTVDNTCPEGTIYFELLFPANVMRITTLIDVAEQDWAFVLRALKALGVSDPVFDGPYWDRDVDVWIVSLDTP